MAHGAPGRRGQTAGGIGAEMRSSASGEVSARLGLAAATGVVLVAAALRFRMLAAKSLWMDELRQVHYYSSDSVSEVIQKAATQNQPPLDYLIGYGLHLIGLADSDWWVRFPAAVFGVLGVVLIIAIGTRADRLETGLLAGFFAALSPLHIHMSQQARPYTIFTFLLLAAVMLYIRARVRSAAADWVAFGLLLFLCLMTRWLAPLVVVGALLGYALVRLALRLPPDDRRAPEKRSPRQTSSGSRSKRVRGIGEGGRFWRTLAAVVGALARGPRSNLLQAGRGYEQ